MRLAPLQTECTIEDTWLGGEFIEGVTCVYTAQAGAFVMALMLFAGLAIGIAAYTQSLVVPAVLMLLIGGVAIGVLPAVAINVAVPALIIFIALVLFMALRWFQRM